MSIPVFDECDIVRIPQSPETWVVTSRPVGGVVALEMERHRAMTERVPIAQLRLVKPARWMMDDIIELGRRRYRITKVLYLGCAVVVGLEQPFSKFSIEVPASSSYRLVERPGVPLFGVTAKSKLAQCPECKGTGVFNSGLGFFPPDQCKTCFVRSSEFDDG